MLFVSETTATQMYNYVGSAGVRVDDCGKVVLPATTADAGKVVLGGGFRLPATTADAGKVVLGGGFRLPATTADAGKVVR